jgi:hypothetical protein
MKLEQAISNFQETIDFSCFQFLDGLIPGVNSLNPEDQEEMGKFLTGNNFKLARRNQLTRLITWVELLDSMDDLTGLVNICKAKTESSSRLFHKNLTTTVEESIDLERSYRSLNLFFLTVDMPNVPNVSFLNADLDQLTDLDDIRFLEVIKTELHKNFRRLDLTYSYSFLVIPGFLRSKQNISALASYAYKNSVLLLTDYRGDWFDYADDLIEMAEVDDFKCVNSHFSNIVMTCNWLLGRDSYDEIEEEEPLFLPPSLVMAGRLYKTPVTTRLIHQKLWRDLGISGTMMPLVKPDIQKLIKLGMVPFVEEYGKVIPLGESTLHKGGGIQENLYLVRIKDYFGKVLIDYLRRKSFKQIDEFELKQFRMQVNQYFEEKKWDQKSIENYKILSNIVISNKIEIEISITPFYPSVEIRFRLIGEKRGDQYNFEIEK